VAADVKTEVIGAQKMVSIFISYRRDDERASAARIRDHLASTFGSTNVFMDVDNLLAGQRFDKELETVLAQTDCLLAVIGSRWLELLRHREASGEPDYVREEIANGLNRGIVMIPVLIDDANLPRTEELPDDIRNLVLYQKQQVSHERFGSDVKGLIYAIRSHFRAAKANRSVKLKISSVGRGMRRLGIMLSIVWAIGEFFWSMSEDTWAGKKFTGCANDAYRMFGSSDSPGLTLENQQEYWERYQKLMAKCNQQLEENGGAALREKWYNTAAVSLIPIPFGWLCLYLFVWITRWVARGFQT
jgi:hypothetical protein